jgi:hypothetical protein
VHQGIGVEPGDRGGIPVSRDRSIPDFMVNVGQILDNSRLSRSRNAGTPISPTAGARRMRPESSSEWWMA